MSKSPLAKIIFVGNILTAVYMDTFSDLSTLEVTVLFASFNLAAIAAHFIFNGGKL